MWHNKTEGQSCTAKKAGEKQPCKRPVATFTHNRVTAGKTALTTPVGGIAIGSESRVVRLWRDTIVSGHGLPRE